jgi:hypothetical protein
MTGSKSKTQEVADEFHMMVGYCIAEWARVEDELFRICHAAMKAPKEQVAVIYYRTPQLDARLTLTDELIRLALPRHKHGHQPHDDLRAWDKVLKQIRDLLPVRNQIAHHPVEWRQMPQYVDISFLDTEPESWFEIYESENERMRGRSKSKSPLKVDDLKQHLRLTNVARGTLYHFYHERFVKHITAPPS